MKVIFLSCSLMCVALALAGCGMMGGTNVNVNVSTNANANKAANTVANALPANVAANASNTNTNANANARPTSGPKRITFTKGSDWSSENLTLAAGESRQFVVSAGPEQYLSVESSSPDAKLLMITKKGVSVENEGASIGAVLAAKGEYVFEVRNPGSKEVKTSVKVQITDEGGE